MMRIGRTGGANNFLKKTHIRTPIIAVITAAGVHIAENLHFGEEILKILRTMCGVVWDAYFSGRREITYSASF